MGIHLTKTKTGLAKLGMEERVTEIKHVTSEGHCSALKNARTECKCSRELFSLQYSIVKQSSDANKRGTQIKHLY